MYGIYYRTLQRNEGSGDTWFYFTPSEPCKFATNGLLRCHGVIGIYAPGTPISIEGNFDNGVFTVKNDYIPVKRKEDTIRLLEYISNDFTDVQKEAIADVVIGDLFSFVKQEGARELLIGVLKKSKKKEKLADLIIRKVKGLCEKEEITKLLLSYGIPVDRIMLLFKRGITKAQLKSNPYIPCLFADIEIEKIETIAKELCGIQPYTDSRLTGFVLDAILSSEREGNVCITPEVLCNVINYKFKNKSLYPDIEMSVPLLNLCLSCMTKYIHVTSYNGEVYIYTKKAWEEEQNAVRHCLRLQSVKRIIVDSYDIDRAEREQDIEYNERQKAAFDLLKTSGIKVLTGPPGSGKTAVIKGLIGEFFHNTSHLSVRLSATTGKASQVLSMACDMPAETVNKMIDVRPYDNSISGKNLNNPINADFIIVDEVSMLGLELFSLLVQAVKSGSILLLVGDSNQLQSVDYGNVLQDLIESHCVEVYQLTEIMRQSGTICDNALRINKGINSLIVDNKFQVFELDSPIEARDMMKKNYKGQESLVLTPIKGSGLGTKMLNAELQPSRGKECLRYGTQVFYRGDPVIMNRTNYDMGYFNGDTGIVLDGDGSFLLVQFTDKTIRLTHDDFFHLSLAYAVTVHKAQGSEENDVHVLLPDTSKNMLTRRILYTAVTRAKDRVFIYSVNHSMNYAIHNTSERKRKSLLSYRLRGEQDGTDTRCSR